MIPCSFSPVVEARDVEAPKLNHDEAMLKHPSLIMMSQINRVPARQEPSTLLT